MPPLSAQQNHFRLAFPLLCWPSLASVGGEGVGFHRRCSLRRLTKVTLGWPSFYSVGLPWHLSVEGGGLQAMPPLSAHQNHFRLAFPLLCWPSLASVGGGGGWGLYAMRPPSAHQNHSNIKLYDVLTYQFDVN